MPIVNNMVAGAVCYVCLIVMASAAQKPEPSFNMPTCDEFKDRLTHTKSARVSSFQMLNTKRTKTTTTVPSLGRYPTTWTSTPTYNARMPCFDPWKSNRTFLQNSTPLLLNANLT